MWLNKTWWYLCVLLRPSNEPSANRAANGTGTTPSREEEGGGWGGSTKFYMGRLRPKVQPLTLLYTIFHGSYNLEKVLNFISRLKKTPWIRFRSLKSTWFLYKVLKLKSLKFTTLSTPDTFFCKIRVFLRRKLWLILVVRTCKTHR